MPTLAQRRAGRVIKGFMRKAMMRRRMGYAARKGRYIRRTVGVGNPTPTFVETYQGASIVSNVGGVFSARITDIPQVAQYNTLYKQYRINWIKVIIVPKYNYESGDVNSAAYNAGVGTPYLGSARITYAINDSPQLQVPANEAQVLQDNGAKIKKLGSKLGISFKPVPDVGAISGTTGNPIWTRQKYRQWFNFDTQLVGNNPLHYGVSYFITQLTNNAFGNFDVFYKVSFSLRDPQ